MLYFKPTVAKSLGHTLYPSTMQDEVWLCYISCFTRLHILNLQILKTCFDWFFMQFLKDDPAIYNLFKFKCWCCGVNRRQQNFF